MYRWTHKPIASWQARRRWWLQKYILACTCGLIVGMLILAGEMAIFGSHGRLTQHPVGNSVTIP